ncbi:hypothetical protein MNBD_IGNAVI01-78 [hydrothermal vent metagenome]|uniref:Acyl-phosphate:glycerol-3-phosphate O-acyltransferase PlsY n=1 Tax=hydrothermal vent metagenome TaxID=652676 RepID=A0A3B1CIM3_9ZZZZ
MDYFIIVVIGFFIGIFPNHFLFEKLFPPDKHENNRIRTLIPILLDLIKGLLIVFLTKYLLNFDFLNIMLALIIGTLFHSFFQEFKFQRREGQTVALAGLSLFIPLIVLIWIIIWLISFAYKRNKEFSLTSATFLTGLLGVTSSRIFNNEYWYSNPLAHSNNEFKILITILFILILSSQIDKIKAFYFKDKSKG